MNKPIRSVVALTLVAACTTIHAVGSFGCGSTPECNTICQQSQDQKCTGAPLIDCDTYCTNQENLSTATRCTSKFNALMNCIANASDVCKGFSSCNQEGDAYATCTDAYCKLYPDDGNCVAAGL